MSLLLATGMAAETRNDAGDAYRYVEKSESVLVADDEFDVKLNFESRVPQFTELSSFAPINKDLAEYVHESRAKFGKEISSPRKGVEETLWAEVGSRCEVGLFRTDLVSVKCTLDVYGSVTPHHFAEDTMFTYELRGRELRRLGVDALFPGEGVENGLIELIVEEWRRTGATVIPGDLISQMDVDTQASLAKECLETPFLRSDGVEFGTYRYPNGFTATIPYCSLKKILADKIVKSLCPSPPTPAPN